MTNTAQIKTKEESGFAKSISAEKEWIKKHFPEVIILKDFDNELLKTSAVRELPQKRLLQFDREFLKDDIFIPNKQAKTIAEKVLSILLNSNVRRGPLAKIEPFIPEFLSKIRYFTDRNLPIQLVLPSLPHKKLNPITTGHTIDFIDLGDYLCIQQLKNIILSIQRFYSAGARITLLPDGITLAHLFAENDLNGVTSYSNKLQEVMKELGISELIDVRDLNELFLLEPDFGRIKDRIKKQLLELAKEDLTISKGMVILQKAMLFNVPFRHSIEDHMKIMKIPFDKMPIEISEQLKYAAFEYTAILLTMKKLNIIKGTFPNALRTSVHDKVTSNFPLNLINNTSLIFPYNGIPVVRTGKLKKNGNMRKSTRIMRLYEIYKYPSATAVYLEGQKEPFYYEIGSLAEISSE